MNHSILKVQGANFYGFESIDSFGKRHYHPLTIRGNGDLYLTNDDIYFTRWGSKKDYTIPLKRITKVEIKAWHNFKNKFPRKVLRIHYKEESETKIFGVSIGGNLNILKGRKDETHLWKGKIESLLKTQS
uniref:hypothetical protein n=1 Tax=uncultured Draconibacterium sp. TaxID=1573823 RepID=UPI0032175EFB